MGHRIPEPDIERVKRATDLRALVQSRGIELRKHGSKDWIGRCPFHADQETPNFIVTPEKGLFHCMACGAAGNAIQFVARHDGISFRHAFEVLNQGGAVAFSASSATEPGPLQCSTITRLPCPLDPEADDATLFGQVVSYYHERLKVLAHGHHSARAYLESRGLLNEELITRFQIGVADRTLGLRLPFANRAEGEQLRRRLQQLGLWRESGHEHFNGCIVVPLFDAAGKAVSFYGRRISRTATTRGELKHLYCPGSHRGLLNRAGIRNAEEVILCEAVLDALTFCAHGFGNVTCLFGTEGFSDELWEALRNVRRVKLAYDADDAGERAAQRDAERFRAHGIEVFRVKFPHGMDANEYARKVQPPDKALALLLNAAQWCGGSRLWVVGCGKQDAGDETTLPKPDGVAAGHRPGATDLPTDAELSQARDVCAGRPDAAGGGVDPSQHRRGPGTAARAGVPATSGDCQGQPGGVAHAAGRGAEAGLPGRSAAAAVGGTLEPGAPSADGTDGQAGSGSGCELRVVGSGKSSSLAAVVSGSRQDAAKEESRAAPTTQNPQPTTLAPRGDAWFLESEGREYRVSGLDKTLGTDALKVTLRLRSGERFHLDQLDLCRDAERRRFVERAAEETGLTTDLLKRDLGRLLLAVEQAQVELAKPADHLAPAVTLTPEERDAALQWLREPQLIERLRAAFHQAGIIGEETNTLVAYLAGVSRKLERPLAIIIQSASAAGKTTLMDAVLSFFPEEERVKYSAMTGQSLYYLGETNLKHKILAVVEEAGAEKASYALKLLQSEGELTIASTGKDPATGKMVTQEYHVEGPVMIFLTTTAIDLDEELQNRCLTLAVDESAEQTGRIHRVQRERRTLAGLIAREERQDLLKQLRNAQRLLSPVDVLNPFAPALTFPTERTRNRRDHEKYLTLIDSIALLHQHQRSRGQHIAHGRTVEFIEVTLDDIALANELAPEILGRSLDELPPQTRRLLGHIRDLVKQKRTANGAKAATTFSRKELRDSCGWSLTQVRVHLERLVELEYLAIRHGRLGSVFVYEVLFDLDAPEAVAHVGLIDVRKLQGSAVASTAVASAPLATSRDYTTNLADFSGGVAGPNGHLAGDGQTPPPPVSANADAALVNTWRPGGIAHLECLRTATVL